MLRYLSLIFLILFGFLAKNIQAQLVHNPKIRPSLWQQMQNEPQSYHKIRLILKDRVDIEQLDADFYARKASLEERAYKVITLLQEKAAATQTPILASLQQSTAIIKENTQALWITNMILAEAKPSLIIEMSQREDIDWIEWDADAKLETYSEGTDECAKQSSVNGVEPGLKAIKAPFMWKLGYTGNGKVLMSIDTGVDYTHPAINSQWRGNYVPASQAWYYPASSNMYPIDCDEHGTHTVGTMVGMNITTHDTIGVAFRSTWIGAPGITCPNSSRIAAFQWSLNPDNNPNTIADMPDVINNSWYDPNTANECGATNAYKLAFDACEAAGIAIVFSAGNDGPNPSTITKPKNISTTLVNVFCVANVNGNVASFPIASSSSRGPSACGGTGSFLIKPEVSAPGTNVRSCIPGGGYVNLTGTSMAAPHAAGAIALIRQAFPTLTGSEAKLALYYSCTDLGVAGEDNDYGMGMINLEAAYNYLIGQGYTPVPPTVANDVAITDLQNLPATTCNTNISPTIVLKNNGTNALTSLNIVYKLSNGFIDSLAWTGNLAAGTSSNITLGPISNVLPGLYNLEINAKKPNGQTDDAIVDNKLMYSFKIFSGVSIISNGATILAGNTATISATTNPPATVAWYHTPTGGNLIDSAATFTTPILMANKTYYADAFRYANLGKLDNTSGNGGNHTAFTGYLIFDAFQNFTLQEVTVYAATAGVRMIEVRNASGAIVNSKSVNIPAGESRVTLNLTIPSGNDLQLGVSVLCDLYRSTSGVSFPYQIPGVLSIKGASTANNYFYFYDWKIAYPNPCGRMPTLVTVQGVNIDIPESIGSIKIAPNPNQGQFELDLRFVQPQEVEFTLYDLAGKEILNIEKHIYLQEKLPFDMTKQATGTYFLEISMNGNKWTKKIVKE